MIYREHTQLFEHRDTIFDHFMNIHGEISFLAKIHFFLELSKFPPLMGLFAENHPFRGILRSYYWQVKK